MDFGTLLQAAKQNDVNKKEVRSYSTKFAPPKKENKKDKLLSDNIKKFLVRKENEEKKKMLEANKKRDDLLALRSKDKKATRRVNVMLKRTKSANQSVIDDAVDNDNTAVTLAGPAQPDEDDYGYVSQEASAFYTKMMEKYNKMPEEQKFPESKKKASSNLSTTKDRVKAALEKEKLDAMLPHRRKRKHADGEHQHDLSSLCDKDDDDDEPVSERKSELPPKAKPKNKGPPPMNFSDLLKLASQKQHEPIMVEVKPKDNEVLFTKKQKHEMEKEQQRRGSELGKLSTDQINDIRKLPPSYLYKTKRNREVSQAEVNGHDSDSDEFQKPDTSLIKTFNKKDVTNKLSRNDRLPNKTPVKPNLVSKSSETQLPNRLHDSKTTNSNKSSVRNENSSKMHAHVNNRPSTSKNLPQKNYRSSVSETQASLKPKISPGLQKQGSSVVSKFPDAPRKSIMQNNIDKNRNNVAIQQKSVPFRDQQPKQTSTNDSHPKQHSLPDVRRKETPKQQINKRRIMYDDDEEEYDSEMDDFIDDDPEEGNDYSTHIREIFGYDKRKFKTIDDEDDIDNMESSFAQQMREDVRSTRLGILEDLEDMEKEKEEKRLKALKKKGRL